MKYPHLLAAFASEIWAMEPGKLMAVVDLLAMQAEGLKFTAEEIEARIAPQTLRGVARREGAVAVVPMRGIISPRANLIADASTGGGLAADTFTQAVEAARDDEGVKAIVLDADTPGGNVIGVEEASAAVASVKGVKPIIVQVTGNLASAGYWIGASADEIVVSPSSEVGAIGVRTAYDDITGALEKRGISREIISAGKFKGEGLLGPLSDETRAHVQSRIDAYYDLFVARVAAGRNVGVAAVKDGFGQGRMLGAKAAVAAGMADSIGTMAQTLARLGVTAQQPSGRRLAPEREKRALALN